MNMASNDRLAGISVVLDLDGTIIDTASDIIRAANAVLCAGGFRTSDAQIMRGGIAYGAREVLARAIDCQGRHPETALLDELEREFLLEYEKNLAVESIPYPGVTEALCRLKEAGAILSLCTNKRQAFTESILNSFDLAHFFSAVVGGDVLPVKKPHKEHIFSCIAASAGRREWAVMVGDSEVDVAAARAAGVPIFAVTYGYPRGRPEDLGADRLIHHFAKLPDALIAHFSLV